MPYYVYFLRNSTGQLYIGQTSNLSRRRNTHKTEKGAKFARDYDALQIVYFEKYGSRREAMKRERQLKGWRRAKKEALIAGDLARLKEL